jgi:hypothetical protein
MAMQSRFSGEPPAILEDRPVARRVARTRGILVRLNASEGF